MTTLRLTIDIDLDDSADPQTITDQAAGRIWSLKGVKQGGDAVRVATATTRSPEGYVVLYMRPQEREVFDREWNKALGKTETCNFCDGTGNDPGGLPVCRQCNGFGKVLEKYLG